MICEATRMSHAQSRSRSLVFAFFHKDFQAKERLLAFRVKSGVSWSLSSVVWLKFDFASYDFYRKIDNGVFFKTWNSSRYSFLKTVVGLQIDSDEEPKIKQSLKKWTKTDKTGKFESYDES